MSYPDWVEITNRLATPLAWPLVAVIALFVLRKHLVTLAEGLTRLHGLLDKASDIAQLTSDLSAFRIELNGMVAQLADLKSATVEIKHTVESIDIKGQSDELERLTTTSLPITDPLPVLPVDDMFSAIEEAWKSVKGCIQNKALANAVTPNFMGTKGVTNTVQEMVAKNVITRRAAELAIAVSAQYQRFYRTSSPKDEWLTPQVYKSFLDSAEETKRAIQRQPG